MDLGASAPVAPTEAAQAYEETMRITKGTIDLAASRGGGFVATKVTAFGETEPIVRFNSLILSADKLFATIAGKERCCSCSSFCCWWWFSSLFMLLMLSPFAVAATPRARSFAALAAVLPLVYLIVLYCCWLMVRVVALQVLKTSQPTVVPTLSAWRLLLSLTRISSLLCPSEAWSPRKQRRF